MMTTSVTSHTKKILSFWSLALITIGSVDNVRNLPTAALHGSSLILFFLIAGIGFLVPSALVCAELAAAWSDQGGVYRWVKEGLGERWAFLAIYCQWIENVIWYPTILSFIVGTSFYVLAPGLMDHLPSVMFGMFFVFWLINFLNLFGLELSTYIGVLCAWFGLLVPMILIMTAGFYWWWVGKPLAIELSWASVFDLDWKAFASLPAIVLSCTGIEITSNHALDVENPQRDYPRALLLSVFMILITLVLGSLSVAVIVPLSHLSLLAGITQTFEHFLGLIGYPAFLGPLSLMMVLGSVGVLNNWILAPCRGFLVALQEEKRWNFLVSKKNPHDPRLILLFQGVICSALICIFWLMPSLNSAYLALTNMASQLYMIMYALLFISALRLRYSQPNVPRPYVVPGGLWGMWITVVAGLMTTGLTFVMGFVSCGPGAIQNSLGLMCVLLVLISPALWWTEQGSR